MIERPIGVTGIALPDWWHRRGFCGGAVKATDTRHLVPFALRYPLSPTRIQYARIAMLADFVRDAAMVLRRKSYGAKFVGTIATGQ